MTITDFKKEEGFTSYISKEKFLFENDKVKFWYRIYLSTHTYQPTWNANDWETSYQVLLVVDDESIHEKRKNCFSKEVECGFLLKESNKKGHFDINNAEKVLNSALKVKIENKIKVDKYQKILGIINGDNFFI